MTTPEKQYVITQSQIAEILCITFTKELSALMQSLPELSSEPVKPLKGADWTTTMRRMKNSGCSKRVCSCTAENAEQCIWWDELGDNPKDAQPLQPITDADVTGEMLEHYIDNTPLLTRPLKRDIAAAYNAVIKHRSIK